MTWTLNLLFVYNFLVGTFGFILDDKCGGKGFDQGKISYSIKNLIQDPTFFYTVSMSVIGCNDTILTRYMEAACDQNKNTFHNFSNTYFPNIGYYISAINGISEIPGESFWELIEHTNGHQLQVGHDTYIPQTGDHIAWNLTLIGNYQGPTE